jgi:hypothetical protein
MRILFTTVLAVALACILVNQINNLAYVLAVGSPDYSSVYGVDWRVLAAVSWSVGIELGVLVSVLSGKHRQAAVLAVMSCAVNLSANQVWTHPVHIFVAKTTVYAISAYLLWFFSELVGTIYANSFLNWLKSRKKRDLSHEPQTQDLPVNSEFTGKSEHSLGLYTASESDKGVVYNEFAEKNGKQPISVPVNIAEPVRKQPPLPKFNGTVKVPVNTQPDVYTCPYCDWKGNSRQARHNHINRAHSQFNQ